MNELEELDIGEPQSTSDAVSNDGHRPGERAMKYQDEYRDPVAAKKLQQAIER